MKRVTDLSLKTKIIAVFFDVSIIMIIIALLGIYNIKKIDKITDKAYNTNIQATNNLEQISDDINNIRINFLTSLNEPSLEKNQIYYQTINSLVDEMNSNDALLDQSNAGNVETDEYKATVNSINNYSNAVKSYISLQKEGRIEEALNQVALINENATTAHDQVEKLIDINQTAAQAAIDDANLNAKHGTYDIIAICLIGYVINGIFASCLVVSIVKPLRKLINATNKIAEGDLTITTNINRKDEIGQYELALRKMVNNFNSVVTEIQKSSDDVAVHAKKVTDTSIVLAQGSTEQASSIEELTSSMEEISAQIKQNADDAYNVSQLAGVAKENALKGNSHMDEMQEAMKNINTASQNISKIIKVIDDIAFQTNILALNAAVEAARVGENGKGFEVVAEEVRNLAARSANAANETTEMIEDSIKKVEGGTKIATETSNALHKIVNSVTKVAEIVQKISDASAEQASGVEQINQGIIQVSSVVQSNTEVSERTASSSEQLSKQAETLKKQANKFKIKSNLHDDFELHYDVENMLDQKPSSKENMKGNETEKASASKITLTDVDNDKYNIY